MPSALLHEKTPKVTPIVLSAGSPKSLDMMRALCHDLRQPLAAIRLLAGGRGGNVRRRFDGILEEAYWLSEMVEGVIGGAADVDPFSRVVGSATNNALDHLGQPVGLLEDPVEPASNVATPPPANSRMAANGWRRS